MPTISEALAMAIEHHQRGQLQAAEQIYRQILEVQPDHSDALHLLGVIASMVGKHELAIQYMTRALELNPHNAEAHSNLSVALKEQGKHAEAAACCRRALALKPDYAEAHNNLGNALKEEDKLDEAVACYRRALALKPDYADAYNNLGNVLQELDKLDEAVACLKRALALRPHYAEAYNNLGNVLTDQGKLDEALACYQRALALNPNSAEAHYNMGVTLKEQGRLDEAIVWYQRTLALKPAYADAHNNLGNALRDQRKFDEADACYRQALALKPDFANAHLNQSLLMLLTGDFERGWRQFEWRWRSKQLRSQRRHFAQPLWDGQPLADTTILLYAEQGLGDTIQFVRYAPLVKERGGRVVLECQPSLLPLFAGCRGVDQTVARGEPLPTFETQAPLLSLPSILRTTLANIPADVPYLQADPNLIKTWRQRLEPLDGFKIGIVWQGNPQVKGDRQRSIPLRHYEALARVPGTRLVSLQKGPGLDPLAALAARFPVLDLGEQLKTFSDTAAVLKNLDLVVSSCTSVPHLAGALGVPVWLALAHVPDWRWLLEREDSPWYPTMRLFRQGQPGDWGEVFERMSTALAGLLASS